MKTQASPGFVPDRLKQARVAMELSVFALAEQVGLTRQSIDQFEKGKTTPSEYTLQRLSEKLKQPNEFFFKPLPSFDVGNIFYRSRNSSKQSLRDRVEVKILWLAELIEFIESYVDIPAVNLPDLSWIPPNPYEINQSVIERVASQLREFWGIPENHPISNLTRLLELNGFIIATDDLYDEGVEALSAWSYANRGYILIHKYVSSAVRMRFGIAHELGHLILHQGISKNEINRSSQEGKNLLKILESQSHAFAGALLAPKNYFVRDTTSITLDRLRVIKSKWLISIGAMIKRLENVGEISPQTSKSLFINYNRRGWRYAEPLDDILKFEEPTVIPDSINLLTQLPAFSPEGIEKSSGISFNFVSSISRFRYDKSSLSADYASLN